jgi:Astacin (Peptidase family M12A)
MHYGSRAASKNGKRTIVTKDVRFLDAIGQRGELSAGDIQRINTKYKCTKVYKPAVNILTNYNHQIPESNPYVDEFRTLSSPYVKYEDDDDDNDDEDLFNI